MRSVSRSGAAPSSEGPGPGARAGGAGAHRGAAGERVVELLRLCHPYLVRGYELHRNPRPVLILETLGGDTLGELVDDHGALDPADLAEPGRQLCSVVGYLHRHGVLHLDLKPSNIVIEARRMRLLDLNPAQPSGPCGAGHGTREYMAPEQFRGGTAGPATGAYGIGGVLYRPCHT